VCLPGRAADFRFSTWSLVSRARNRNIANDFPGRSVASISAGSRSLKLAQVRSATPVATRARKRMPSRKATGDEMTAAIEVTNDFAPRFENFGFMQSLF